jgi:hypothetical protein
MKLTLPDDDPHVLEAISRLAVALERQDKTEEATKIRETLRFRALQMRK